MITYVENVKNVNEYNILYEKVGWGKRNELVVKKALDNTVYSISAYDYGKIVGYGRIIGDKTIFLYIQDVMVDPEYQGRKIGTEIMYKLLDKIEEYKKDIPGLRVYLGASYSKEGFYKKFGFKTRKEAGLGEGMILQSINKESKLFNWEEEIPDEELYEVKRVLDNGGIIIMPTDTVYGIACNCFNERAIEKLFDIKTRARYKPINVLTDSVDKMNQVAKNISKKEQELIDKYMPGSLTIIFDKKDDVPKILTGGLETIGIRIPNDARALSILKSVDYPLATTSANISGQPDGVKIEDFIREFDGKVDIIIDGGITDLQQVSTIVQVDGDEIKLIREGTIIIE